MVTNDVVKLKEGESCYAAHLNPQGKMVAQMDVLASGDSLWLVLEREVVPRLAQAFDKLIIMEDVQVSDESEAFAVLGVIGSAKVDGMQVRTPLGSDLIVKGEVREQLVRSLVAGGATVIDRPTWEILRTEAGLPVYGVDIDDTTTMPELGERGISYDKGCYVGQEVVAKVKYIGHVNRRFVGLVLDGDSLPKAKSSIRRNGKDVGYITSCVRSAGLNRVIALGFVGLSAQAPGTAVEIVDGDVAIPAAVSSLPFRV